MFNIKLSMALKPWFKDKTIKAAELLLQDRPHTLYYRGACAAIFPNLDGYCLLNIKRAPQLSQGFRLEHGNCTICGHRQRSGDHCQHLAALAASVLLDDETHPVPGPLIFPDSSMFRLGKFLERLADKTDVSLDGAQGLRFKTGAFSLYTAIRPEDIPALIPIFRHAFTGIQSDIVDPQTARDAWQHLFFLCRSENEQALNEARQTSKGQAVDRSLWMQLAYHLFMRQPQSHWQLQRQADGFYLSSGPVEAPDVRISTLPEHLPALLKATDNFDLITVAGPARAYSKIYFRDDDSLMIEPWLELDDGGKYRRDDINDAIFGNYCAINDNIFYEIKEQEDDFSTESDCGGFALLAFAKKQDDIQPIIIPPADVPAFLDKHLRNILSGRHDPALELADFSIDDLPDAIEVLDYNEDDDWCYLSARYSCGSRHLDLREIMSLRESGMKHATGREKWLNLRGTPLDWLYELADERLQGEGDNAVLRLTKLEMMALNSLVPEMRLPTKGKRRQIIASRLANLRQAELADADIPTHLRDYQRTGLAWLNHLYINGIGGILADDMGLGKTHQALALLQLALRTGGGPALIVCPASVMPHWQDKLDNFYPELSYEVYYGPKRALGKMADRQVLLTTYNVMRQDAQLLAKVYWGLIVFDEIHYLKNRDNATSKAAALLNCRVCFGLSGTPIENSLTDLKSVYDICLPELLGGQGNFRKTYVVPIEERQDKQRLKALKRLIQPFMLRRDRQTVLQELPEVIDDCRFCHLSADQQALYRQAINEEGSDLLAAAGDESKPFPHLSFLALVQRLKQICNHPAQLSRSSDYDAYKSGKWELFKEIIDECLQEGLKVVVFSQYTAMLDIIARYLADMDIPYTGLRGDTSMAKRQSRVKSFNTDTKTKVFCASLLAGGTGIDLTGAQAVIHYDRWWNAAKEEQATARVHRFGQRQAVQVFKFITTGTLEEKLHRLITRKQNLAADAVQCDDGSIIKRLSRDEIASILQWSPGSL
jgi:superfamily II DNA or RNA helicase